MRGPCARSYRFADCAIRRKIPVKASLLAALTFGACAAQPPTPERTPETGISFVHGCWVEKQEPGGPALGFLRLLPEGQEYVGMQSRLVEGEMQVVGKFALARDGSYLKITKPDGETGVFVASRPVEQRAPDRSVAEFSRTTAAADESVVVYGEPERLGFAYSEGVLSFLLFERDGCD